MKSNSLPTITHRTSGSHEKSGRSLTHYEAYDSAAVRIGQLSLLLTPGQPVAEVDYFYVDKPRRGTGSLLLKSTLAHLQAHQYTYLKSASLSIAALHTRRKVHGDVMQFYDPISGSYVHCDFEEAVAQAQRAEDDRVSKIPCHLRHAGYGVVVDLSRVKTDDWEQPKEYHQTYINLVQGSP